ncbi:MAG TPA: hypothetical protein VMU95_17270 [Trebonia sp.]|nr:hypothetical protein [Trebonia sp.]
MNEASPAGRAARLLRWYPRAWRNRYGEEFTELLLLDMAERPRCRSRTVDVIRGGIVAHLAEAGLCGFPAPGPDEADRAGAGQAAAGQAGAGQAGAVQAATGQVGAVQAAASRARAASLASLSACLAVFVVVGAALWSQLTVGWQWSAPASTATVAGMVAMSGAMLAFAALALLAVLPVAWVVVARLARGVGERDVLVLAVLFMGCLVVLFIGGRHFGNGWPGTGGHPWPDGRVGLSGHEWVGRGLVPAGFAAFAWAATLSVTTYWLHPAALAGFPAAEIAWMAASPVTLLGAIWSAATIVRRVGLPPRVLAFQAGLARVAIAAMLTFLAGCGGWVASGGGEGLYRAGTIDAAGVGVLTLVLAVAGQAARRSRRVLAG